MSHSSSLSKRSNAHVIPCICGGSALSVVISLIATPQFPLPILLGGTAGSAMLALAAGAPGSKRKMIDGRIEVSPEELERWLAENSAHQGLTSPPGTVPLRIGQVALAKAQEEGNLFVIGRPGSGKSQAIFQFLEALRKREDYRVVILDRGGEVTSRFAEPTDLIFNPLDGRSAGWSHRKELEHLPAADVAEAWLPVPQGCRDRVWYEQGQILLAELFKKVSSVGEMNYLLDAGLGEVEQAVQGTKAASMFYDSRLATSVWFTLLPALKAYEHLSDFGEPLSFYDYGRGDDTRWLFLPLLQGQEKSLKSPLSAAVDMTLRGILSRVPNDGLKTVVVIDELGALQKLESLNRFLAEGRKYGGRALIGTQTDAQMTEVYGKQATRALLQNTLIKLILNCPDPETSRRMADAIGKQRFWEQKVTRTENYGRGQRNSGTSIVPERVEQYVVQPSQLQMLPDLKGYLLVGDDSPVARVRVPICQRPETVPRFVPDSVDL